MKTKLKILANSIAIIFTLSLSAIIINLLWRFGATPGFWAGFGIGIIALIVACAIISNLYTNSIYTRSNKFFLAMRTRQQKDKIKK